MSLAGGPPPNIAALATSLGGAQSSVVSGNPALQALAEVDLVQLSERLLNVTRTLVVGATVISQSQDGTAQIRTQAGDLVIKSPELLPLNRPLMLQIHEGSPPKRALVLGSATDMGTQPSTQLNLSKSVQQSNTAAISSPMLPAAVLQPGDVVGARMIGKQNPFAPVMPSMAEDGAEPALTGIKPSAATTPTGSHVLPQQTPSLPASNLGSSPLLMAQAMGASDGPRMVAPLTAHAAPSAAGPALTAQIIAIGEQTTPPLTSAASNTQVVTGTVIGSTIAGQTIIGLPAGTLTLDVRTSLPLGTPITLTLSQAPAPQSAASAQDLPRAPWSSVQGMLQTLDKADPATFQMMARGLLPQPGPALATALAHFIQNARSGDARGWIGERAAKVLEKSASSETLDAVGTEFREIAKQAEETPPGGWRSYPLPLFAEGELQHVMLHVRRPEDEEAEGESHSNTGASTRFLVELDMSRLGPLQLDGLVRTKRFDLIVRSKLALDPDIRTEMAQVFSNALGAIGFTGSLTFHADVQGWVKVPPRAPTGRGVMA